MVCLGVWVVVDCKTSEGLVNSVVYILINLCCDREKRDY